MLWLAEHICAWESSLLKKLLASFPVRLFETLGGMAELFAQGLGDDRRPSHILVHLDSLGLELREGVELLGKYQVLERCSFVSQSFCRQAENFAEKKEGGDKFFALPAAMAPKELVSFLHQHQLCEPEARGEARVLRFADVEFNFTKMQLKIIPDGECRSLPLKEARLLNLLMQGPNKKCWSREELRELVWDGLKVSPRTIDSHISRLRKKLQDSQLSIENRYGNGYMLA